MGSGKPPAPPLPSMAVSARQCSSKDHPEDHHRRDHPEGNNRKEDRHRKDQVEDNSRPK